MLKIFQARLQQYMNCQLPDVQAGFRKGRGTRDQIANICWIMEKAREFQKNIYFCFIDYAKAFDCVDHNKLWKILKEMGISDHLTCLRKICMQIRKEQFSSVTQLCLTLCDHMDCSTPGFPVLHQLLELHKLVHQVGDAIQTSHPLSSPSPPAFNFFPASGFFPMSQFFTSNGQSFGVSASTSVLPMNIQD